MINKKLIALFVAIATVSGISAARCYTDKNGVKQCRGPVRRTARFAGNVVTFGGVSRAEKRNQQEQQRKEREEEEKEYSDDEYKDTE